MTSTSVKIAHRRRIIHPQNNTLPYGAPSMMAVSNDLFLAGISQSSLQIGPFSAS